MLGAGVPSPGFPPRRRADATPLPGGPSPQAAKSGAQAAWPPLAGEVSRLERTKCGRPGGRRETRGARTARVFRGDPRDRLRHSHHLRLGRGNITEPPTCRESSESDVRPRAPPPPRALADWRRAGGRAGHAPSVKRAAAVARTPSPPGKEAVRSASLLRRSIAERTAGWCLDHAAAAGPSTCFPRRHGAGGVGDPRGMWCVRVHRFWRLAHAARCAACDHSGTRGATAPVSNRMEGWGWSGKYLHSSTSRFPSSVRRGTRDKEGGSGLGRGIIARRVDLGNQDKYLRRILTKWGGGDTLCLHRH